LNLVRESPTLSAGGFRVQHFIRHFVRDREGSWICVEAATLEIEGRRIQVTPGTRVAPGDSFMGVDLARMLEEQAARDDARGER
jgi:hypothetical protein